MNALTSQAWSRMMVERVTSVGVEPCRFFASLFSIRMHKAPSDWRLRSMEYTPVSIDIAEPLILVHFINEHSFKVVDRRLRRQDFLTFFSNREYCLIGMEACGGSQHRVRELTIQRKVQLLQARFKALVIGNKNDEIDARAIYKAVQQPGMDSAVKTEELPSGTLPESGETIRKGRAAMERELPAALKLMKTKRPPYLITVLEDQYNKLNATAAVTTMRATSAFKSGRERQC